MAGEIGARLNAEGKKPREMEVVKLMSKRQGRPGKQGTWEGVKVGRWGSEFGTGKETDFN